jgi:hypothetical protein
MQNKNVTLKDELENQFEQFSKAEITHMDLLYKIESLLEKSGVSKDIYLPKINALEKIIFLTDSEQLAERILKHKDIVLSLIL